MKICIIGGGASGLYCAVQIKLRRPSFDVTILEKNPRVGKKLLSTGNGKCNFTNTNQATQYYTSENCDAAFQIIEKHAPDKIMQNFSEIGVESAIKGNLVYPKSMQASSVLDALRFKAEALGVHIRTDFNVKNIKSNNNTFTIDGQEKITCDIVVVATGTHASGGTNAGLKLLRAFGHRATASYPALVPVACDTTNIKLAKGMRTQSYVTLLKNDVPLASETGEILFTDYGVSGICILQLSHHIAKCSANGEKAEFKFVLDFAPDASTAELTELFTERKNRLNYLPIGEFFSGYLNKKIGQSILKSCNIHDFNQSVASMDNALIDKLVHKTKTFSLTVKDTLDASFAQACGGGILLDDFTPTLQSKKQKNLFACGEVLDVLGDCGGYNLTWAWASAHAVATSIADLN